MSGRVNSRLTHCQHNPRGSLLENPVLRCQVASHNSLAGLRSATSRARPRSHAPSQPKPRPPPRPTPGRGLIGKPSNSTHNITGFSRWWHHRIHPSLLRSTPLTKIKTEHRVSSTQILGRYLEKTTTKQLGSNMCELVMHCKRRTHPVSKALQRPPTIPSLSRFFL